jgi:predicted amidohydrolase
MPGPDTAPLFHLASELGIGFSLGFAELVIRDGVKHRFNTSILVDKTGRIAGKYRKIHLPGHAEVLDRPGQHLEKRFFEVGDLGFPVFRAFGGIMGMCICNDRRWPETYRVMGLQGVEMVLLGYNTPVGLGDPFELDALEPFHNHLVMQSGAYQNATWVVGVAKAGLEEGFNMIGQTCIIAPSGEIVAMCCTMGDELVVRKCDLDMALPYRADIFNFAAHRRPEHYALITSRTGAVPPP